MDMPRLQFERGSVHFEMCQVYLDIWPGGVGCCTTWRTLNWRSYLLSLRLSGSWTSCIATGGFLVHNSWISVPLRIDTRRTNSEKRKKERQHGSLQPAEWRSGISGFWDSPKHVGAEWTEPTMVVFSASGSWYWFGYFQLWLINGSKHLWRNTSWLGNLAHMLWRNNMKMMRQARMNSRTQCRLTCCNPLKRNVGKRSLWLLQPTNIKHLHYT